MAGYRPVSRRLSAIYLALPYCTEWKFGFSAKAKNNESLDNSETETVRTLEADPYFDGDETELLLQKAIATLPDKQRVVFNLKYFDEMKYEEMSELLETSVGALKASYHLAVKKIEQFFHDAD